MNRRFYELDALRGVAALSVLFFHYFVVFRYIKEGKVPESLFKYGVTGVDLFFLISGYVIFLTVIKKPDWKEFLISRFSRLYPAYWVSVLITATALKLVSPENPLVKGTVVVANMTMFQRWMNIPDINPPYWTLSVELMFYLVVLLFLLAGKGKPVERLSGILFLVFLAGITLSSVSKVHADFIEKAIPLFAHANLFCAGVLFCIIKEEGNSVFRMLGILTMLVMVYPLHHFGGTARDFITPLQHMSVTSLYFILFFFVISGRLSFIASKSFVFLGEISYPLYLIHQTLGFIVIIFFLKQGFNFITAVTFTTFFILLLSSLITFFIEKPATKKLRKLFRPTEKRIVSGQQA